VIYESVGEAVAALVEQFGAVPVAVEAIANLPEDIFQAIVNARADAGGGSDE
jgi:molybdopterin biosynthesis enzyme